VRGGVGAVRRVGDIDEAVEFQNIFSVVVRGQSPHTRRFDVTG